MTGPGDTVTLDPGVARACLYHDCDPATADWAIARLGPQPLISLLQRILARRCVTAVEWPTGHTPFLSRPDLPAGLLAGLATRPAPDAPADRRNDPAGCADTIGWPAPVLSAGLNRYYRPA